MGCFLACFGSSKDDKRRKIAQNASPRNPNIGNQYRPIPSSIAAAKQENLEIPVTLVPESRSKPEEEEPRSLTNQDKPEDEQLSLINQGKPPEEQLSSATRKKVTFNSNVKEYEHIPLDEAPELVEEIGNGGEKGVSENCTKPAKSTSSASSESGSTLSSLGSYPPNHRYQNCRESDDEGEELDCEVSDLDEDEDALDDEDDEEEVFCDDEYSDDDYSDDDYTPRNVQEFSLGSCSSMESRTKYCNTRTISSGHDDPMLQETKTPELKCSARDRSGYVHSVLNPVENTKQWKAVKARGTPPLKQQKENFDLSYKQVLLKSNPKLDRPENNREEVAVDASLSTWLVSSQKTPPPNPKTTVGLEPISSGASGSSHGSNSVRSHEERPILGALTVEELKKISTCSSPRRSLSRSPDDKPLVGTVGAHWSDRSLIEDSGSVSSFKGIPNTTSKYREDKKVNWHSTPFETRLERALNRGAAGC